MRLSSFRHEARLLSGAFFLIVFLAPAAQAGGPRYIAGVSYFDSGTMGVPLTWAQGSINYYTDQGDLSAILPGPSADAFVADAFSQWTAIPTAAVAAARAGQLAEDVNGSNVFVQSGGSISMPSDILPTATGTPVGIVYDEDGAVTDALLGQGAGDSDACFYNAAFGGIDNFGRDASFLHALVVINGNCAQTSSQLPDMEYRLVRVLGHVLGLDWSQANLNVITGIPAPQFDDYYGFTIMHAVDPLNCVPISVCYSNNGEVNPYQPKMDDQAALSRLYPVTTDNQGNFPGKQLFYETTIRIHGSVYFADSSDLPAQPMQGVNVVARWIDPTTGQTSRQYVATTVSGFLFSGNVGNIITGFDNSSGAPFNEWGSNDQALEGWFDLAGLQIPDGESSAQYQLTVEGLDPLWSQPVGPYGPWQVTPSGTFPPVIVTVSEGGDLQQDLVMQGGAVYAANWFTPYSYAQPALMPSGGDWGGSFGSYGDTDYFWFAGQANRTLSVEVTALDESGQPSETKAQPVIGLWALSDPGESPAPANTPSAFNTSSFGVTMLNAELLQSTSFRLGIADYRGDGRPDYRYHARIFYGDHSSPARASVGGGTPLAIQGLGFHENTALSIGATNTPPLAVSATQLTLAAPAMADGVENLTLSDPETGATSAMTSALTYGAGPADLIILLSGANPGTPVGGQAPNPIRIEVVQPDGLTPVPGASVFFSSSPPVAFSACGSKTSCTVLTDQSGQASTQATVLTAGVITITAQLAPATYNPPQQVQTTLLGTSSSLDLALSPQYTSVAEGASASLTLTARVLSNGKPLSGRGVNYYMEKGSASFSSSSTTTDSNGYATTMLSIAGMSGDVQVAACAEPGDVPCATFYGTAIPTSAQHLQAVAGGTQLVAAGQSFGSVMVRVTDSAVPPNPVLGAAVVFQSLIGRTQNDAPIISGGDTNISRNPLPVVLASTQSTVISDANGLATFQPSTGGFQGALAIVGTASTGAQQVPFQLQSLWPITAGSGLMPRGGARK